MARSLLLLLPSFLSLLTATSPFNLELSPFEFVDEYVGNFRSGLDLLKKSSLQHRIIQDFDSLMHNETLAFGEAEEFDFIIVGGGASGAALASRLSEEPKWRVLLLEAGGPETEMTQVPSMHPHLLTSSYTWGYLTVPQKSACLGMIDKRCSIITGKALGGDSSINDMLFTRGHPRDYDIWSDRGLKGWCWESVYPYFKMMENAFMNHEFDKKFHHYGGPVHLENFHHVDPLLAHNLLQAGQEIGLETIDYNGKHRLGLGVPQVIAKHGRRYSVAKAYLEPAHKRHNLVIIPHSHVLEVMVSPHTKEASGVKYFHNGKVYMEKACKEVILSAGAINTPHILMLSGIGPKEILEPLGIPVAADLCVGCFLQDQISFMGLNFIFDPLHYDPLHDPLHDPMQDPLHDPIPVPLSDPLHHPLPDPVRVFRHGLDARMSIPIEHMEHLEEDIAYEEHLQRAHDIHEMEPLPLLTVPHLHEEHLMAEKNHVEEEMIEEHSEEELIDYLRHGKGPLSTTGLEVVGFVKTEFSRERTPYPDVQFLIKKVHYPACHHFRGLNLKPDIHDVFCKQSHPMEGFNIEVILLHPISRGLLTLHDKDPFHQPWINPNALHDEDEHDIETILAGVHKALKLAESPALQKLGAKLVHEKVPECDLGPLDDEYWRCAIRHLSVPKGNMIGTAKMAPMMEKGAVVDQELRVYGVHKLRVADASIVPNTVSGNLMAPEIMIGEKAADLIKKEWIV